MSREDLPDRRRAVYDAGAAYYQEQPGLAAPAVLAAAARDEEPARQAFAAGYKDARNAHDPRIVEPVRAVAKGVASLWQRISRAPLPPLDEETLANCDLALTLRDLLDVAEGWDRSTPAEEVRDAVQTVCEALFAGSATSYEIPEQWWLSAVGQLCRVASAVVGAPLFDDDEVETVEGRVRLVGLEGSHATRRVGSLERG